MITVIGSLNYDLVTYTDRVPDGGETFQANSFENHLGGKGLNEAIACARLSKDTVRMVGNIGSDTFGKELFGVLVEAGVDTSFVTTIEGKSSGVAVILVETNGENRILITAGANEDLKPSDDDYERIFPSNDKDHYVLLQNEYPDTLNTVCWLRKNRPGVNVCYNPSPFSKTLLNEGIMGGVDLLIVNEGEANEVAKVVSSSEASSSVDGMLQLAKELQKAVFQGNVATVVITMGSTGCVYASGETSGFAPAQKVENVVDTTGAGDTFFGGLVGRLGEGGSLGEAVDFATRASSLVIQRRGAVESIPKRDELSS